MNKPAKDIQPNDAIGPLDEHGQQRWTPEEDAASARMLADPDFWAGIAEAEADIAAGRVYTTEQVREHMQGVRQRYLAERGR